MWRGEAGQRGETRGEEGDGGRSRFSFVGPGYWILPDPHFEGKRDEGVRVWIGALWSEFSAGGG